MGRKTHHVVPDPKGGWNVRKGGTSRASGHFDTKKKAEKFARKVSINQNSELIIHGKDGKIQKARQPYWRSVSSKRQEIKHFHL
jgi:hypothetical protein